MKKKNTGEFRKVTDEGLSFLYGELIDEYCELQSGVVWCLWSIVLFVLILEYFLSGFKSYAYYMMLWVCHINIIFFSLRLLYLCGKLLVIRKMRRKVVFRDVGVADCVCCGFDAKKFLVKLSFEDGKYEDWFDLNAFVLRSDTVLGNKSAKLLNVSCKILGIEFNKYLPVSEECI